MLTFANPLFLWALPALAIPVVLHLLNRERPQALRFPSVRYLLHSQLPQEGRRSPTDLLLLMLRLLLLAAIIFALAEPRWQEETAVAGGDLSETTIFLVDASASMSRGDHWEQENEKLDLALDGLSRDTPAGLVIFAADVVETEEPTMSRNALRQAMESSAPQPTAGKADLALQMAYDLLPAEGGKVVIISDFQSTTWQTAVWPRVVPNASLDFRPVDAFRGGNVAILDARVFPAPEGGSRVLARLRNFGDEPGIVTLDLADETQKRIEFEAGQTRDVVFELGKRVAEPGRLALKLDEDSPADSYSLDNELAIWLGVPPPVLVRAIVPELEQPDKVVEYRFVRKALEVGANTALLGFDVEPQLDDFPENPADFPADILYLAGSLEYFGAPQADWVRRFLEQGGVVLATPGKNAPKMFRLLREAGITDTAYVGSPGRTRNPRNPHRIGDLPETGPLADLFDEDSAQDLYLAEIYQYVRLDPDPAAQVIVETETAEPLLLRQTVGQGTLFVTSIGLDPSWSDLPLRNAFLPLLRELLSQNATPPPAARQVNVGESIAPNGEIARTVGVIAEASPPVVVNVPRSESVPQVIPIADLAASMRGGEVVIAEARDDGSGLSLWPWIALAALMLLLAESVLSGPLETSRKLRHA